MTEPPHLKKTHFKPKWESLSPRKDFKLLLKLENIWCRRTKSAPYRNPEPSLCICSLLCNLKRPRFYLAWLQLYIICLWQLQAALSGTEISTINWSQDNTYFWQSSTHLIYFGLIQAKMFQGIHISTSIKLQQVLALDGNKWYNWGQKISSSFT